MTEVICENLNMLGGKSEASDSYQKASAPPAPSEPQPEADDSIPDFGGEGDDLPF